MLMQCAQSSERAGDMLQIISSLQVKIPSARERCLIRKIWQLFPPVQKHVDAACQTFESSGVCRYIGTLGHYRYGKMHVRTTGAHSTRHSTDTWMDEPHLITLVEPKILPLYI
jgi:hypothetical protein